MTKKPIIISLSCSEASRLCRQLFEAITSTNTHGSNSFQANTGTDDKPKYKELIVFVDESFQEQLDKVRAEYRKEVDTMLERFQVLRPAKTQVPIGKTVTKRKKG